MIDYARARDNMVEGQLRTNDVTDRRVLSAMREVPRERFVPEPMRSLAYMDEDLIVTGGGAGPGERRALIEPRSFAKLLQTAEVGPGDEVLDIGCATGYSTAVIARLARRVVGLESDPGLAAAAREALSGLAVADATVVEGPLQEGCPGKAFDVIVLEGSVGAVPSALLGQLKPEGRLVAVVGSGRAARAMLFRRGEGGAFGHPAFDCAVSPLPGFRTPPAFVF